MSGDSVILDVAYESQHDNESGQGYRECFSSACGAVARYWGKVGSDDEYGRIRRRFGDTTNSSAQVSALLHLGLKAQFRTDGSPALLRAELERGRPVVVGWIHKGGVEGSLHGSGHYSVVSGIDGRFSIHQDPYGECDIVNGGYLNTTGGKSVAYTMRNWRRRWEVVSVGRSYKFAPGSGWCVTVAP
jgi:hypothetical protein